MRGNQLAVQCRISRGIESRNQGAAVAELAVQERCHSPTIWRALGPIQAPGFPLHTFHIPIPFTVRESMSLYCYRDILRIFKNSVFYESLDELFRKVRYTLCLQRACLISSALTECRKSCRPLERSILQGVRLPLRKVQNKGYRWL